MLSAGPLAAEIAGSDRLIFIVALAALDFGFMQCLLKRVE
jgi:hypothetical protein